MNAKQMIGYSKTPTPLPEAPRRVRGNTATGLGCARVFMLPHMVVGVVIVVFLLFQLMWLCFASSYTGVVTGTKETQRKGVLSYSVSYRFNVEGEEKTDTAKVGYEDYVRFGGLMTGPEKGREVEVRYFAVGSMSQARLPAYESAWALIGFLVVFGVVWNGIMWVFVRQTWVLPIRTRRLYVNGEAATGQVISKKAERAGKSMVYRVVYTFTDPVTGELLTGQLDTTQANWGEVHEGDAVTVLYRANKPRVNTVYELGGYEVV